MACGGRTWTLDQAMFGSNAALRTIRTPEGWRIRLLRATLPGTAIPVGAEITLTQRAAWRIRLSVPALGVASEMDVEDWLRGEEARSAKLSGRYAAGHGTIKIAGGRAALSCDGGLTLRFLGDVRLDGRVPCSGDGLKLRTGRREAVLHDEGARTGWSTHFSFDGPDLPRKALTCGSGGTPTLIRLDGADAVSGEFFTTEAGADEVLVVDGPARLELRRGGRVGGPLRLRRAAVAIRSDQICVAGEVCREGGFFHSGAMAIRYRGDGATPFSATFPKGAAAHFAALVHVSDIRVPIAGGEAQVAIADRPTTLSTQAIARPAGDFIVVDAEPMIVTKLDGSVVRVRSPENLLDLQFSFTGFELRWGDLDAPLLNRTRQGGSYVDGSMVVEFPPQHLSETIQELNGAEGCVSADAKTDARLSRASRVAFHFPRKPPSAAIWKSQPLTIERLTDWTGLTMAVDPRALSTVSDTDVLSQLAVANIGRGQDAATVLGAIGRTIVEPSATQTSLELADQLVFSPAENAAWERSELNATGPMPIFGMRLGNAGSRDRRVAESTRLRALYSRRIPDLSGSIPPETALSTGDEPFAPLTVKDHWEIIGQTSVYGLPALRRVSDSDTLDAIAKSPDDPALIVTKVARSGVVRPDGYTYLDEFDHALSEGAPETGIALASAFQTADVTLTSLGATMLLDWRGQPPLLRSLDGKGPKSFSLERLLYQTWLGRDVRVVAVHKGYLFPFGIPATYVTVSERVFLPGAFGRPVAKEIRRRFVTASSAPKRYPTVNQPDGGRDFPAAAITMLTTRTPDLINPIDAATGLVPGFKPGEAFWPMVRDAAGNAVDFDWNCRVDEEATPLVNRMLFVSQTATGEDDVGKIVAHYNGTIAGADPGGRETWPARNVARLGGARRAYAARRESAPAMPGRTPDPAPVDTAYDTDSWLLVARGRSGGDGPDSYVMDARMNGADQPPFYPSVRRAAIAVQSIDRLVGRPQGMILARPYQPYVTSGFDHDRNGAEIFLEIVAPVIMLDVAGEGRPATGGVAQPATKVAALSRISGVVGGSDRSPAIKLAVSNDVASQLDFSSAAAGKFDPKQFFSPKIFGIDLLKGLANLPSEFGRAPRLSELTEQGVGAERADAIRSAAAAARKVVAEKSAGVDAAIAGFTLPGGITFRQLYPELSAAYEALKSGIDAQLAIVAAPGSSLTDATAAAISITALAKPFFAEVGRLARDPVPPLVSELINRIVGYWTGFADLLGRLPQSVGAELRQLVTDNVAGLDALGADQLALLFGLDHGETIIALATQADARAQLGETLLYEQIGGPVIDLIESADRLLVELTGTVVLRWTTVRDAAEAAIDGALGAMAGTLVDDVLDPTPNILRAEQAEALATALADVSLARVRALTAAPDLTAAVATLRRIAGDLTAGQATYADLYQRLDAEVRSRAAWFKAGDPAAALDRFAKLAVAAAMTSLTAALTDEIARVLPVVQALEGKALDVIVEIAIDALQTVLSGGGALERLASVAGHRTSSWCSAAVGGVLDAVKAIGDRVLADQPTIERWIAGIGTEVAQVQLPATAPAPIVQQFGAIKAELGRAVAGALAAAQRLGTARAALDAMTAADTCAATTAFAGALRDVIAERGRTLRAMRGVVLQVSAVDTLSAGAPADVGQAIAPHLAQMASLARSLVTGASVAGQAGLPGAWDTVARAKNRLLADVGVDRFRTDLAASYDALVAAASAIRASAATATPATLVGLTERTIMLAGADRRLAGLVIETVALEDSARTAIENGAIRLVKGAVRALRLLHEAALGPLLALQRLKGEQPVVAYLLNGFTGFDGTVADVVADIARLKAIEGAADFDALVTATDALRQSWAGGDTALLRAVRGLGAFVDAILKGKFSELVGDTVRRLMTDLQNELRDLVAQFVPTRIQTHYDWNTRIDPIDAGLLAFSMDTPSDTNLFITTSIDFNFLTGERDARVTGKLEAFSIAVDAHGSFFTLHFDGATFDSINGASPSFDARFKTVELGPALTFLKQLQQLLGSSDNGLYVQPQFDRIRVGYGFARDQVNVGPLIVSNVALDVYAELPFTSDSPEFGFLFASPARPFLISYPPYGGGGWVKVVCHPGRTDMGGHYDIGLSLMFGAVTDINFGPLQGHGRVCCGIEFLNDVIKTFVEAVGEGSIACFSISIYIGIFLEHDNSSGSLDGEAILEFKFKVAFCTFKYKVTARRHLAGPSGSPGTRSLAAVVDLAVDGAALVAGDALRAVAVLPGQHTHATSVPSKSHRWTRYRRLASLELLVD